MTSDTGTTARPAAADPPTTAERATAVEAVRSLSRAARVLDRAAGDLGMSQYRVLSAIAAGEERASRVAERFELGRPAVSAAVDALCRDGLVRRTEAPGDQRAFDLAVTPAGRSRLEHVENHMVAVLSDLCAWAAAGAPVGVAGDHGATSATTGASRAPDRVFETLASLGPAVDALLAERYHRRRRSR